MKITFYGHASLGIEIAGKFIIVDPYISANPKASHIDIHALKADYILLTHAHQDHILDVEAIAKRTNATIISNAEIAGHYSKKGLKSHPMNHGGSWKFDFGTVKFVNAIHSSSFPDGTGLSKGVLSTIDAAPFIHPISYRCFTIKNRLRWSYAGVMPESCFL